MCDRSYAPILHYKLYQQFKTLIWLQEIFEKISIVKIYRIKNNNSSSCYKKKTNGSREKLIKYFYSKS